jgi:large subunit ribosomal protein L21
MYAVVQTGGKQYKVSAGDVIQVEKLETIVGESVTLDKVLMTGDGDDTQVGAPFLNDCSVTAEVSEQLKDKKIIVFKKRRRKNYRRKNGHRQLQTRLKITSINKG